MNRWLLRSPNSKLRTVMTAEAIWRLAEACSLCEIVD